MGWGGGFFGWDVWDLIFLAMDFFPHVLFFSPTFFFFKTHGLFFLIPLCFFFPEKAGHFSQNNAGR